MIKITTNIENVKFYRLSSGELLIGYEQPDNDKIHRFSGKKNYFEKDPIDIPNDAIDLDQYIDQSSCDFIDRRPYMTPDDSIYCDDVNKLIIYSKIIELSTWKKFIQTLKKLVGKKQSNMFTNSYIVGLKGKTDGYYYPATRVVNYFSNKEVPIPKSKNINIDEFSKYSRVQFYVSENVCQNISPDLKLSPKVQKYLSNSQKYYTFNNGINPFLVIIKNNPANVLIMSMNDFIEDIFYGNPEEKIIMYGNLVKEYKKCDNIFIGKSPKNKMTEFSGAHGQHWDGNSILIKPNKTKLKYIFIGGHQIYEFEALSEITDFLSPIGNNDCPYPFAVDEQNNIYLMIENKIILNFPINSEKDFKDWEVYDDQKTFQCIKMPKWKLIKEMGQNK